uniref:Uncharacterized protein n=1 Tax=Oryza brachyantha TaxID=4533 RepID=J3N7S4_ORYBR
MKYWISNQFKDTSGLVAHANILKLEVSIEEIAENGKKWMTEEAFKKYIEGKSDLAGDTSVALNFATDALVWKTIKFPHYNFNGKMKKHNSDDCTDTMYLAEVKMIFRRKYYFCCPLEPLENDIDSFQRNQILEHMSVYEVLM